MTRDVADRPRSDSYLALLRVPGARAFVLAGFFGRLPMSMLGLGVVVLISGIRHSYGLAGAVSATLTCAGALGAPMIGALADRFGQRRVLRVCLPHVAVLAGLCLLTLFRAPLWSLFVTAALTGATMPPVPSMLRARWMNLLGPGSPATERAFALEAVVDELVFIAGPVLVTLLGAAVAPVAGLVCSAVFVLAGCLLLAHQRGTEPALHARIDGGRGAIRIGGVRVLVTSCVLIGVALGTIDVGMVAFASHRHLPAIAGLLLATVAAGSGSSAVWYGRRQWRAPLHRRFVLGAGVLAVSTSLLAGAPSVVVILPAAFLAGTAISPVVIPAFGLVERLVPRPLLTEGFTWVSTAFAFGVGIGVTVSGRVIDAVGPSPSFLVCPGVVLAAGSVALSGIRFLRRTQPLP